MIQAAILDEISWPLLIQGVIIIDTRNVHLSQRDLETLRKIESGSDAYKKCWLCDHVYVIHFGKHSNSSRLVILRVDIDHYIAYKVRIVFSVSNIQYYTGEQYQQYRRELDDYWSRRLAGEHDQNLGKLYAPNYKWKCSDQGRGTGDNTHKSTTTDFYRHPIHNIQ